jgi:hypothetical protein
MIEEDAKKIEGQEDFIRFLAALDADYKENSEEWEHVNLGHFLEALAACASAHSGNAGIKPKISDSPWQIMAQYLLWTRYYE